MIWVKYADQPMFWMQENMQTYIGTNVRDAAKIDFTYVVKEDTVTEQLSRKATPYHLQKRMLADGSYEELPQREYVEEEGLPRQDKYAIGLPCPDTRGQKGIDFLDFLGFQGSSLL